MTLHATLAGRATVALGVLAVASGVVFAWPAAVLAGWGVLAAVVTSVARLQRLPAPDLRIEPPGIARAGQDSVFQVAADAQAFRPATPAPGAGSATASQPASAPWQPLPGVVVRRWDAAGTATPGAILLRRTDRMRWWSRHDEAPIPAVTVLPSLLEVAQASSDGRALAMVLHARDAVGAILDVTEQLGVRDWAEGSTARHIDWKVSSRLDRLMEKTFERESEMEVEVVLDATSAARRREGPGRQCPMEVAVPTALHLVAWARAQGRRTWLTCAGDEGILVRTQAHGATGDDALRAAVAALPPPLAPWGHPAGDAEALPGLLRRLRTGAAQNGLVTAARPPPAAEDAALFLVSPLDVAPALAQAIDRAASQRHRRILVQVSDHPGSAGDATTLERAYLRQQRRRANAARLAARGWVCAEAPRPRSRAQVLREVAKRVET